MFPHVLSILRTPRVPLARVVDLTDSEVRLDLIPLERAPQTRTVREVMSLVQRLRQGDAAALLPFLAATEPAPATGRPPRLPERLPTSTPPTRAHPRAFRGTKRQPPKRGKVRLDLLAAACDSRTTARLLRLFGLPEPLVTRASTEPPAWEAVLAPFRGAGWTELLQSLPEEEREAVAARAARTGAAARPAPDSDLPSRLAALPPTRPAHERWDFLLRGLAAGSEGPSLLLALELDAAFASGASLPSPLGAGPSTLDAERLELAVWRAETPFGPAWVARDVWEQSSRHPWVALAVQETPWDSLEPEAAGRWLRLLQVAPAGLAERWRRVLQVALSLPMTSKYLEYVHSYSVFQPSLLEPALDLLPRLCRPPHAPDVYADRLLDPVLELAPDLPWTDRTLAAFERVADPGQEERFAGAGLRAALLGAPEATRHALVHHPRALMRAVRRLGCLPKSWRAAAVAEAGAPGPDWTHRLRDAAVERLRGDLPHSADEHALRLLRTCRPARRRLRRLLLGGRPAWEHPRNVEWLSRRPEPTEVWRAGLVVRDRDLILQVEQDPLEVLRMGTHVGSCFALGGPYADSAVSAALDANKRVVFARDGRGCFVARQLLGLTEEGTLLGFPVYPRSSAETVTQAFARYDHEFARALGVPVHRAEDWTLPDLVGPSGWLDDPWDPGLPVVP